MYDLEKRQKKESAYFHKGQGHTGGGYSQKADIRICVCQSTTVLFITTELRESVYFVHISVK